MMRASTIGCTAVLMIGLLTPHCHGGYTVEEDPNSPPVGAAIVPDPLAEQEMRKYMNQHGSCVLNTLGVKMENLRHAGYETLSATRYPIFTNGPDQSRFFAFENAPKQSTVLGFDDKRRLKLESVLNVSNVADGKRQLWLSVRSDKRPATDEIIGTEMGKAGEQQS
ncbi:MAG: hypothetical protein HY078_16120 [Elusimicrobia bacterium]|nr:hypothetical protein [Elusimicrobiota bacterium]